MPSKAERTAEEIDLQRRLDSLTRVAKAIHVAARRLDKVPGFTVVMYRQLLQDAINYMDLRAELEEEAIASEINDH